MLTAQAGAEGEGKPITPWEEFQKVAREVIRRRNLEHIQREIRILERGWWEVQCPDCGRVVYCRKGRDQWRQDWKAHKSWAHPVYRTRRQSIQETGRRPGQLRRGWFR